MSFLTGITAIHRRERVRAVRIVLACIAFVYTLNDKFPIQLYLTQLYDGLLLMCNQIKDSQKF